MQLVSRKVPALSGRRLRILAVARDKLSGTAMTPDHPNAAPQPSRWLLVFSWLIVVGCICLGSLGIATLIARAWDPCSWVASVMFVGGAALIGTMQYRGTFRRNRNAATFSMVILFVCGGFLLFAVVMCSGEFLIKEWELPPLEMLATAAGLALLIFPAAWLNLRWSRRLNEARDTPLPARRPWQLSLQELLVFTAAAGLALAIITAVVRSEPAEVGNHVEMDNPPLGIPRGATDICWRQGSRGILYLEFTVEEESFRRWVTHYIDVAPREVPKELRPVTNSSPLDIFTYQGGMVTVTDGLAFSWAEGDGGVHAVWERPTKRVYFYTHSH
jgi:hypothetical protein